MRREIKGAYSATGQQEFMKGQIKGERRGGRSKMHEGELNM